METDGLKDFIDDVDRIVRGGAEEHAVTKQVARRLSALLASGCQLAPELTRPSPDRHLNYPLYVAPDDAWCLAAVVWNAGQRTPVHGHQLWGVAGIYSGAEHEIRYAKPAASEEGHPLAPAGEHTWERGQTTVCCTTDDDVHAVEAAGDEPTIGLHVYGGNIGTTRRPSYDPGTGAVQWFVSGWDQPAGDGQESP